MPLYEFKCKKCDALFEKIIMSGDEMVIFCEKCGNGEYIERVFSVPNFKINGYNEKNGYANKKPSLVDNAPK